MEYIAHIRESDGKIQTNKEHLLGVKELAEIYGNKIGVKHIAGLAGVLHDLGKYTHAFRDYLLEAVNNPDVPPKRGSVDHSTAGGKLLYEMYHTEPLTLLGGVLAEVVGNAVLSHHSYLLDFLSSDEESPYLIRVRDKKDKGLEEFDRSKHHFFAEVMSEAEFREYVSAALAELEAYRGKPSSESLESKLMFLTKFVFSALIDADRTNTRLFEEDKLPEPEEDRKELFAEYFIKLMAEIDRYQEKEDSRTSINLLRREMSDRCEWFAEKPSGIYTLSIPTGGGKTLASLRYALKHAMIHGKKRIIIVVPYTTIIEQNAKEVRKILLDDENILEHHSNVIEDAGDDDEDLDGQIDVRQKLKLAKDNWDSPIIFTTMVQFLNTFFAKGSRNIRRLHNLSESVIIFDEVQKIPVRCVSLFNQALNFLKEYGNSSLLLCTATQPALDFVEHKLAVNTDAEIVNDLDRVIEDFKRVEIIDEATDKEFDSGTLSEFVANKLEEARSILVILNTKTVVKKLYRQLQNCGVALYHLSTSMCAAHRNDILEQVRVRLKNEERVVCISTQLIEAGVDISFECVIRSLAGLDSIAQAAGRCNRHGKQGFRQVYVIDHTEENLDRLHEIKVGKKVSGKMLVDLKRNPLSHGGHILSKRAMERYFQELYTEFESSLDYPVPKLSRNRSIVDLLSSSKTDNVDYISYMSNKRTPLPLFLANSYRTAAEHFRVIEDQTDSVIVPYGKKGKEIIAQLNGNESIESLSRLLRSAQQYSVNLFRYERAQLEHNDGLVSLLDGKILALKEGAYNEDYGLELENDSRFDLSLY